MTGDSKKQGGAWLWVPNGFFPKQFTVRGSHFFLEMCPPFVSLLVSARSRWPCSIAIHLYPRSVTAAVRPFPLVM